MTCPEPSQLAELLLGNSLDEQSRGLCDHLSECSRCRAELDRICGEAELKSWLSTQVANNPVDGINAICREMVSRLANLDTSIEVQADRATGSTKETAGSDFVAALAPSDFADDLGVLCQYRLRQEIGQGGMAIVYQAVDTQLDRSVAIKVLKPDRKDPHASERFLREAKSIAVIRHANVVVIHGVSSTPEGLPFIAMELAEGGCLQERVQQAGGIHPRRAAEWMADIADGLWAAHQAGLIHRDIKPSNILLFDSDPGVHKDPSKETPPTHTVHREVAKLADFGLARHISVTTQVTQTGTLLGTPSYMSPEHVVNPESVDARSDIYSLGVTLYESLTGEVPFRGAIHTVLKRIECDEPAAPRSLNSAIPADLETICLKAMHRDPGRRYETAQELSLDLKRWLRGDAILARPTTSYEKFTRWCRRNPGIATLSGSVATLLLVLAMGSAYAAFSISRAESKLRIEKTNVERANEQIQFAADEAQQQRQIAIESLNSLVTKVQSELASRPGTIKLRESILQTALDGLQRVTQQGDSTSLEHTTIVAFFRKGEILDLLGKTSEAVLEFEHAAQLARKAMAASPSNLQTQRDLGDALHMQAEVHRKAFAYDQAEPIYEQVRTIRQKIASELPDDIDAQHALISCMQRIADLHFYRNDWEGAKLQYDKVLALADATRHKFPENTFLKRDLVLAHERLGTLATTTSQVDQAQSHFEQVTALNRELLASDPANKLYQADLAYVTKRMASLASLRGEHDNAARLAHEAIAFYLAVADADPLDTEARMKVGAGWDALYEVRFAAGDLPAASAAVKEGSKIFESLSQSYPTAAKYAVLTMEAFLKLADLQFRQSQLNEALESLQGCISAIERGQHAADASSQNFEASLGVARTTAAALKLAMAGLPFIEQQTEAPQDLIYFAKIMVMCQLARSGQLDQALEIGELIDRYEAVDPYIATSGSLAVARAYAICFEQSNAHDSPDSAAQQVPGLDRSLQGCLAIVGRLLKQNPGMRSFVWNDLDFRAIRQSSEFKALFP